MSDTLDDLMEKNLIEVFGQRDFARREAAIHALARGKHGILAFGIGRGAKCSLPSARQVSKGRNATPLAKRPRGWSNAGLPRWSGAAAG